ncbi:MAG: hypothetical protein AABX14_00705 [Candidatus Aenigmatarchaeota archaeon]
MHLYDPKVRQPLDRIMKAAQRDRTLLTRYSKTEIDSQRITAENISDLSFNHILDDNPDLFGIAEWDGWAVRGYFSDGVTNGDYAFVSEMHKAYPFMNSERREYLDKVNKTRARGGLEPFELPTCDSED